MPPYNKEARQQASLKHKLPMTKQANTYQGNRTGCTGQYTTKAGRSQIATSLIGNREYFSITGHQGYMPSFNHHQHRKAKPSEPWQDRQ